MENTEVVDVKALRAKFLSDSGGLLTPRVGPGSEPVPQRRTPSLPPPPPSPPLASAGPPRPAPFFPLPPQGVFPRPPPSHGPPPRLSEPSRVREARAELQNLKLRSQRPLGNKPGPVAPTPQSPQVQWGGEVSPLRRPLPPDGPRPLKPKRPPYVNLEPFKRSRRSRGSDTSLSSVGSLGAVRPPPLPSIFPQLVDEHLEDDQETYDDIGSFDQPESQSENSFQCNGADEDVYNEIDEPQAAPPQVPPDKPGSKDSKKQREQEKKEQKERQKRQNELWKNFQLRGEVEVLHTARVRHDWRGSGKLELSVRQGQSVEIIRVKNNPGGKWLARSLSGNYGYISNTCVDIDYEEVKRKVLQNRMLDTLALPPPPPDPPATTMPNHNRDSLMDNDDYDDVEPLEDFPAPPPEISLDPRVERELKKKFKFDGPPRVLHSMMVDPSAVIRRPGAKDLPVGPGELVDVIQLTDQKRALCRNQYGKYGYVARSLLLPEEGDIYDDVDYPADVYQNDD